MPDKQSNEGYVFKTNNRPGSVKKVEVDGSWWGWAKSNVARLYSEDLESLTDTFITKVQPLFDEYSLNVDLRRIRIRPLMGTSLAKGYDIFLQDMKNDELSFQYRLGTLLHELGHVIQCENLPRDKWWGKLDRSAQDNFFIMTTDQQFRVATLAKAAWMSEENGLNIEECDHVFRNDNARYEQDAYLSAMPLKALAKTHLLVRGYALDAPCNRFKDLLLALPPSWKR